MSFLSKKPGQTSQSTTLDLQNPLVRDLSAEFRALDALPIGTKKEREEWHVARQVFEAKLHTLWSSISDSLPHEIQLYLDDSDIRAKDESYAQSQRKKLAALLRVETDEPIGRPTDNGGAGPRRV